MLPKGASQELVHQKSTENINWFSFILVDIWLIFKFVFRFLIGFLFEVLIGFSVEVLFGVLSVFFVFVLLI